VTKTDNAAEKELLRRTSRYTGGDKKLTSGFCGSAAERHTANLTRAICLIARSVRAIRFSRRPGLDLVLY
jgi:hypothetical protein